MSFGAMMMRRVGRAHTAAQWGRAGLTGLSGHRLHHDAKKNYFLLPLLFSSSLDSATLW